MQKQSQPAQGQPSFDTNVLEVDPQSAPPKTQFSAKLTFVGQPHKPNATIHWPRLNLGSLVILQEERVCTHAGLITNVSEDSSTATCVVDFWSMREDVHVSSIPTSTPPRRLISRPMPHRFNAAAVNFEFHGSLVNLGFASAEHLRKQIGSFAPEAILQVFWSEGEIAQIQANAMAQMRYEKLAQELINSLYA